VRVIVEWGTEHQQLIESIDQLDQLLDAIAAEDTPPQVAQVTRDHAGTLGIVLGAERSFLHHVPVHVEPPYAASSGDELKDEPFVFYIDGVHHTEAPWSATIPTDAARAAMRHFFRTGELSPDVRWVEA
jgi:Immunity protein Imm1